MLRANVGLSRKVSKDYNSTGFTVNLDGEISAPVSDAEAVLEQVRQLFDLAEEALDLQIDRAQSVDAIASRDAEPPQQEQRRPGPRPTSEPNRSNGRQDSGYDHQPRVDHRPANGQPENGDLATNKQINYLLNIGKRQRLSTAQLERKVTEILGRQVGLYDLTKQAAAAVIDAMTSSSGNGRTTARF